MRAAEPFQAGFLVKLKVEGKALLTHFIVLSRDEGARTKCHEFLRSNFLASQSSHHSLNYSINTSVRWGFCWLSIIDLMRKKVNGAENFNLHNFRLSLVLIGLVSMSFRNRRSNQFCFAFVLARLIESDCCDQKASTFEAMIHPIEAKWSDFREREDSYLGCDTVLAWIMTQQRYSDQLISKSLAR